MLCNKAFKAWMRAVIGQPPFQKHRPEAKQWPGAPPWRKDATALQESKVAFPGMPDTEQAPGPEKSPWTVPCLSTLRRYLPKSLTPSSEIQKSPALSRNSGQRPSESFAFPQLLSGTGHGKQDSSPKLSHDMGGHFVLSEKRNGFCLLPSWHTWKKPLQRIVGLSSLVERKAATQLAIG